MKAVAINFNKTRMFRAVLFQDLRRRVSMIEENVGEQYPAAVLGQRFDVVGGRIHLGLAGLRHDVLDIDFDGA